MTIQNLVIAEHRNAGTITYEATTSPASDAWTAQLWSAVDEGRVSHRRADEMLVRRVDARVLEVATLLGRPAAADMGGTFALQVDLGNRTDPDDAGDSAGIDPERAATWWVDLGGGQTTFVSDLDLDTDAETVAAWITSHLAGTA